MTLQLSFRDIWLDYFKGRQALVSQMSSGDKLFFEGDECKNSQGQSLLKFSMNFKKTLEGLNRKGYYVQEAKINFILYWKAGNAREESKIILPELYLEKKSQ